MRMQLQELKLVEALDEMQSSFVLRQKFIAIRRLYY